jgi:hypothetical protein
MRITSIVGLAAMLAGTPAVAQVIVTAPGNDAGAHQYQADRDRAAARQDMSAARANAAAGNYGVAAQDQAAAHENWHNAHHQEHAAERDSSGHVVVQLGQ